MPPVEILGELLVHFPAGLAQEELSLLLPWGYLRLRRFLSVVEEEVPLLSLAPGSPLTVIETPI